MSHKPEVDITSAEFKTNPYPFYAWLRAAAPVYRVTLPDGRQAWILSRYDDVLAALKDERLVKDRRRALTSAELAKQPWMPGFLRPIERNMLNLDAPDHTRLRGLVHKAFTPRVIEELRQRIQHIAEQLLDAAERAGRIDLIRDFALPLPVTVIAELLGIPAEDQHKFHRWSSSMIAATASAGAGQLLVLPSMLAFMRYIRRLVMLRRAEPRDDLTSMLVQAEETGDQLSEDELVAMIFLLLVAGHETTVNLIGNGVLALLEHRDQLARLSAEPALIKPAIEELLRYASPVELADERYAREDLTLHGVTIRRGEMVYAALASANRDERQFSNPDMLDLAREPNRHLAFSQGIHYCLGAPLARMEGQIAIGALLRRLPDLRLSVPVGALRWNKGLMLRGLSALPLAFTPRQAAA